MARSIAATIKEGPEKLRQQIENLVAKVLENYPPPKENQLAGGPRWRPAGPFRNLIYSAPDR